jgi:hypothetical protein
MGDIYSYAKSVIAWIRVAHSPEDSLAGGLTYKLLLFIWCSKTRQHQARSMGGWPVRDIIAFSKKLRPEWILFRNLCKAEYWSRTWIIQEILLAKKIRMIVEEEEISWEIFTYPLQLSENMTSASTVDVEGLTNSTPDGLVIFGSLPMQMALQRARTSAIQQYNTRFEKLDRLQVGSTPLLELLRMYGGSKCVLIHDKVYALLSLSSDCREFPVDYTTSPAQLCRDLYCYVRPTQDIKEFFTTVASALGVKSEENNFSFRHKVALAVGYYPYEPFSMSTFARGKYAFFRAKGKILGILPEEKWDSTRMRLQQAAYRSHVVDGMLVEMLPEVSKAALPKGYFDQIFASLNFRRYSNSAAVLQSRVKSGDSRIALVSIDECLFLARVCSAAEVGDMLYLVEGSRAALIVRNDHFSGTLIGMAALPVCGKIDASSKALDGVAFQDGPPYQRLSPYWIRQRMAAAITEEGCEELDIYYRKKDILSSAEVDALQDPHSAYGTRALRRMERFGGSAKHPIYEISGQ